MSFAKSRQMRAVEIRFGEQLEHLLPRLHFERNWPHRKVAEHLEVPEMTYYGWWRKVRAAGLHANGQATPAANGAAAAAREGATA